MNNVIRFQVEIDQEQMNELERLQTLGGLRSKRELLDNAITLLKWAARERGRGCSIVSMNEERAALKELTMPFLENVLANSCLAADAKSQSGSCVTQPAVGYEPAVRLVSKAR